MHDVLNEIKGALELEIALSGPMVPVESTVVSETSPLTSTSPAPAATPPGKTDTETTDRFNALIETSSPLHNFGDLAAVEKWVANTVLIPLDEVRQNPVFGVGDPEADLMIIGEAPGADEDRQGEPFVGRAGQLLTKILAAIGFARSEVYIANILKSRPPNNRDPLPAEVAAHIQILFKQIALIRPRVILCVGKTAGNSLLQKKTSLKALRGEFHDFHGVPVMVTYHPAALLRNPEWKKATWEDVQKLRDHYDQLTGASATSS
jgi:DNA polymerase